MKHKLILVKRAKGSQKAEFKCVNCNRPFAFYRPLTNVRTTERYVNKQYPE